MLVTIKASHNSEFPKLIIHGVSVNILTHVIAHLGNNSLFRLAAVLQGSQVVSHHLPLETLLTGDAGGAFYMPSMCLDHWPAFLS